MIKAACPGGRAAFFFAQRSAYRKRMRALLPLILVLAACEGQPVPSEADNRQLDEAANMLDSADDNLAGIDANAIAPDMQEAAPESAAPMENATGP